MSTNEPGAPVRDLPLIFQAHHLKQLKVAVPEPSPTIDPNGAFRHEHMFASRGFDNSIHRRKVQVFGVNSPSRYNQMRW